MIDLPQPDLDPLRQGWCRVSRIASIVLLFSSLITAFSLFLAYVAGLMEGDLHSLHNWPYYWDMEAFSHLTIPIIAGSFFLITLFLTLLAAFLSKRSPGK